MAIKYHIVLYAGLAIALFMLVFVFVKYKRQRNMPEEKDRRAHMPGR